ncbi:Alpha/Beta hydrolase protein [Rhypophila decipiens]|uniref:Alpha/Beta hydrolase protein n=1 Tax=Rhypophila decipiens TaxID=261697 RepID=A0AAN7B651_9PEZI|nr:Alpha/Beta hydrolase protein [Rhypophila decipiens]
MTLSTLILPILPILLALQVFPLPTKAIIPWTSFSHGRVSLDEVSIHFRYAGSGPPLLLVHGNPQYSLTWQFIAPILAEKYTVICPDNRGAGDSSSPPSGNYSAVPSAQDLKGLLYFLNISETYLFSHDKGVGFGAALELLHPGTVKRMGISEYVLPGYGYELVACPAPYWDLYANWQLAFFSVPDAAEFFIRGREKEMLLWYFYHGSYSGHLAFTEETINAYASSISKPGFLRAMLGPFENRALKADAEFFRRTLGGKGAINVSTLALGGEASFGTSIGAAFKGFSTDLRAEAVPKAGHWIADENPVWVANRLLKFFDEDPEPLEAVDLSWLTDKVTLQVGFLGTLDNAALAAEAGVSNKVFEDLWKRDEL